MAVVHEITPVDSVPIKGRMSLKVVRPDGSIREEREGDNVMCTTGFTALAASLVWSGIQDQAANMGITAPTYMTPLWGAVGSGGGSPAKGDTTLFTELGRVVVGAGAASPATSSIAAEATWLFYFGQPASTWTVTEAGLFANANNTSGSGSMLDHWGFSPNVTVPTSDTLILQVSFSFGP